MKHLRPINLAGRPGRRTLKTAPSLSCEAPGFSYDVNITNVPEAMVSVPKTKKDKVAA